MLKPLCVQSWCPAEKLILVQIKDQMQQSSPKQHNRTSAMFHSKMMRRRRLPCFWLVSLLVSLLPLVSGCPSSCICSSGIVDCSNKDLTSSSLPSSFPTSTQVIRLNQNNLFFIPNGLLDNLPNVREVYLEHNPWQCDCDIIYLRSWLQGQPRKELYREVTCASPEHLKDRVIMYLTEDELVTTCQYWYCNIALISQLCLFIFIVVQGILLIFIIFSLRRFQKIAREARRTAKELQQNSETYTYDNIPLYNYERT